ncbi:MAG: threonine/serine exporter family protein [Actinomycetia bacterium]|nr:threonine/serine exporter family protein [Actinomycetes bacterium]MCH9759208.1 threonine/serine exporter family protein [Actinomycetes bacterium]
MAKWVSARIGSIIRSIHKIPPRPIDTSASDPVEVATMLREIGVALMEVNQPVQLVQSRLAQIAARFTDEPARVVALPTVLLIQVGNSASEIDATTTSTLQLDLAGHVDEIATLAAAGAITAGDAITAIRRVRSQRPRFGAVTTTLGYALTTVGFGLVINPTWSSLPGHLFLGLVVGMIVQLGRPLPALKPVLPAVSALTVTLLATWFVAGVADDGLLRVITPALVAMLPGLSLTIGAIELASSHIVAGTSRLVYGLTQLALLVFGVALGTHLAGRVWQQAPASQMGSWALGLGVVAVGLGLYVYLSAPRGSLIWLIIAIGVALGGQAIASEFVGPAYSGFFGAFLSVPLALLATRIKTAPPPIVMLLAAFWSLVPGALSFESVTQAATGGNIGLASLGATGAALVSIAFGTIIGWSVFRNFEYRLSRTDFANAAQSSSFGAR